MKRVLVSLSISALLVSLGAKAQVPDSAPGPAAPAPQPAPAAKPAGSSSPAPKFLGGDVPIFDPANEIVTWDGHSWNLNNNRLFEARFEKYLNAPVETDANSLAYQNILNTIVARLGPDQVSTDNVDQAFRLLKRGPITRSTPIFATPWPMRFTASGGRRTRVSVLPRRTSRSNRSARLTSGMRRLPRSKAGSKARRPRRIRRPPTNGRRGSSSRATWRCSPTPRV